MHFLVFQDLQDEVQRESVNLQKLQAQKQQVQELLDELDEQKAQLEEQLKEVRKKCAEEAQLVRPGCLLTGWGLHSHRFPGVKENTPCLLAAVSSAVAL